MEEAGVGVLNEKEGFWDDLLDREWDCEVEVSGVYFTLVPLVDAVGDPLQMGGLVTRLLFEIGPASLPLGEGGGDVYGKIGKSISFKIFDSIGESLRPAHPGFLVCILCTDKITTARSVFAERGYAKTSPAF